MLIVKVSKGNIEKSLKELKGKFIKNKIAKECSDRREYTKKTTKRRNEKNKAIYLQKKYNNN
jgi:ribosomal protein S21